jgi:hypothetical protein
MLMFPWGRPLTIWFHKTMTKAMKGMVQLAAELTQAEITVEDVQVL